MRTGFSEKFLSHTTNRSSIDGPSKSMTMRLDLRYVPASAPLQTPPLPSALGSLPTQSAAIFLPFSLTRCIPLYLFESVNLLCAVVVDQVDLSKWSTAYFRPQGILATNLPSPSSMFLNYDMRLYTQTYHRSTLHSQEMIIYLICCQ